MSEERTKAVNEFGWDAPPTELIGMAESRERMAVANVHDGADARIALFIGGRQYLLTWATARELARALLAEVEAAEEALDDGL